MSTLSAPSKRRDAVNERMICVSKQFNLVQVGKSMSRSRRQMSFKARLSSITVMSVCSNKERSDKTMLYGSTNPVATCESTDKRSRRIHPKPEFAHPPHELWPRNLEIHSKLFANFLVRSKTDNHRSLEGLSLMRATLLAESHISADPSSHGELEGSTLAGSTTATLGGLSPRRRADGGRWRAKKSRQQLWDRRCHANIIPAHDTLSPIPPDPDDPRRASGRDVWSRIRYHLFHTRSVTTYFGL